MMSMCDKCSKIFGGLLVLAAIVYILVDLGIWGFFGISWYTTLFAIVGVTSWATGTCKACMKKR